jgi:outer membrane immunogenic protein
LIQVKTDIGLSTGQIGYAWNATLLYAKGGAVMTSNRFDIFTTAGGVDCSALRHCLLGQDEGR